jgi:protein-arginine kinase activator protein McsA
MSEAAIEVSEEEESGIKQKSPKSSKSSVNPAPKKTSGDSLKDFSLDKLNQLLDKAINNEDYEKAARIRDEINKRN